MNLKAFRQLEQLISVYFVFDRVVVVAAVYVLCFGPWSSGLALFDFKIGFYDQKSSPGHLPRAGIGNIVQET